MSTNSSTPTRRSVLLIAAAGQKMSMRIFAAAALAVAAAAVAWAQDKAKSQSVEAEAVLQVPAVDYRKEWVQLGTFSVLADKPADGAKELHVVYTARQILEAYLRTGRFPDGAVLVKDVIAARTEALTTGTSSYAGDLTGRFVMVKDGARHWAALRRWLGLGLLRRRRDEANRYDQLQGRLLALPRAGPGTGPSVPSRLSAPAQVATEGSGHHRQARIHVFLHGSPSRDEQSPVEVLQPGDRPAT